MAEAAMTGTFREGAPAPYTPFFTPPFNEARVLELGRPVGHIDSDVLRLRGYSIESRNGVVDLVEAAYCPREWRAFAPHVPSSSVRTGFLDAVGDPDDSDRRRRLQLLTHAHHHLCNTHPSWEAMRGRAGFSAESAELRFALDVAPSFASRILFDGENVEAQTIDHLGQRFALLPDPARGVVLTIAGPPSTSDGSFSLTLPSRA